MNIISTINKNLKNEIIDFNQNKKYEKKVLFVTGFAGFNHANCFDTLLAINLIKEKINSEFFFCDKTLNACTLTKLNKAPPELLSNFSYEQPRCEKCFKSKNFSHLKELGFNLNFFGEYIDTETLKKLKTEIEENNMENLSRIDKYDINIHEHALSNTLRYFAKGNLTKEKFEEEIYKRFYYSSLISYYSFKNLIKKKKYDIIIMSHGIYCPHGIINDICKKEKINTYIYIPSYRKKTFIITKNNTYHKALLYEKNKEIDVNLNFNQKEKLKKYISGRMTGKFDWIWFNKENNLDTNEIVKRNKIDLNKKVYLMLTNVVWDARLHYENNCFENILDWIFETIDFFIKNKNKVLIIRIHPAEITGTVKSRQKVMDEINKKYNNLPNNIIIIPPESSDSTYKLISISNCVLVHSTKAAIEAAYMKKRVIVAGEAWVKGKGFTIDPNNKIDYIKTLNQDNIFNLTDEEKLKAENFAYYIFFKRMIKIPEINIRPENNSFYLDLNEKNNIKDNNSENLNKLIEKISNYEDCIVEDRDNENKKNSFKYFFKNLKTFLKKI